MAAIRRVQATLASTTVLSVPPPTPSLSWTSSIPRMSGARRLSTIRVARSSYLACGSVPARFSTLNVPKDTWFASGASVVSRTTPPGTNVGVVVDCDPLRVRVGIAAEQDPATRRPKARRPHAGVGKQRDLAEAAGRADDRPVVDLEDHALEALVEVDRVVRRVEIAAGLDVAGAVVVDHLGRRRAPAEAKPRRRGKL